jgi:type VI secretion system protein VasD
MKRSFWGVALTIFIVGCAADPPVQPPPPPPTIVNLQIDAGADVNADNNGNGAPVMLRIYELREQSNFRSSDFFALFNNDQATLAADLVRKQEMLLTPGESKTLTIKPDGNTRALGFFAAFRQLDTAQWRVATEFQLNQTQSFAVKLQANQLTVTSVP